MSAGYGTSETRFTRTGLTVVALCFATILVDGYDLIVYGAVVPSLLQYEPWGLTPPQIGLIGSLALVALLIGGLISGPVSDRIGRRKVTLFCVATFSVFMGLCAIAPTPELFGLFRFLAGLGLGGSIPTVSALVIEHSPIKRRSFAYALMFIGYPVGGFLAAVLALPLIPAFGWRVMFVIGLVPLFTIFPLLYRYLPESVSFLLANGRREEAEVVARRYQLPLESERTDAAHTDGIAAQRSTMDALKVVFSKRYVAATLLFTVVSFQGLLLVYGLNQWLPGIMRQAGYPLSSAISFLLVLNLGAIVGALIASWIADRRGSKSVTVVAFLLGGLSVGLLSLQPPLLGTFVLVALAGLGSVGAQLLVNAWVTRYYPVDSRATAVGWAIGFGRAGSIFGPIIIGLVVGSGLGIEWNFYVFIIPAIIGAVLAAMVPHSPVDPVESTHARPVTSSVRLPKRGEVAVSCQASIGGDTSRS
jgi:AAHS family benzoate transporter-like MFS transporter